MKKSVAIVLTALAVVMCSAYGKERNSEYPGDGDLEREAASVVDSFVTALRSGNVEKALSKTSVWTNEWRAILTSDDFKDVIRNGSIPRHSFVSSRQFGREISPKGAGLTFVVVAKTLETGAEITYYVDFFWNFYGEVPMWGVAPPGTYKALAQQEAAALDREENRNDSEPADPYGRFPGNTQSERIVAYTVDLFLRALKRGDVSAVLELVGDNRSVLEFALSQSSIPANSPEMKNKLANLPDLVLVSSEIADSSPHPDLGIRTAYVVAATNPRTNERVLFSVHETLDGSLQLFPSRELVNFLSGNADSPF